MSFLEFPSEILCHISKYIDYISYRKFRTTCKILYDLLEIYDRENIIHNFKTRNLSIFFEHIYVTNQKIYKMINMRNSWVVTYDHIQEEEYLFTQRYIYIIKEMGLFGVNEPHINVSFEEHFKSIIPQKYDFMIEIPKFSKYGFIKNYVVTLSMYYITVDTSYESSYKPIENNSYEKFYFIIK